MTPHTLLKRTSIYIPLYYCCMQSYHFCAYLIHICVCTCVGVCASKDMVYFCTAIELPQVFHNKTHYILEVAIK